MKSLRGVSGSKRVSIDYVSKIQSVLLADQRQEDFPGKPASANKANA